MKLALKSEYKSIKSLDSGDLPDFTVLTGLNGSGKSHLLEAISNGHITIDGEANDPGKPSLFRLFTFATLVPNNSAGAVAMSSLGTQRVAQWSRYATLKADAAATNPKSALVTEFPNLAQLPPDIRDLSPLDPRVIQHFGNTPEVLDQLTSLDAHIAQFFATLRARNRGQPNGRFSVDESFLTTLQHLSQKVGRPVHQLTEKDFYFHAPIAPSTQDAFQQSFNQLFANYQAAREDNNYQRYQHDTSQGTKPFITDAEFINQFGSPPWETINRILESARISVRVTAPPNEIYSNYQAKLIELKTQAQIDFSDLSSGEKIITSFALCLYYAEDNHQIAKYPKVLLFDEIDATLHPSMTQSIIDTIERVLVAQNHIKVILTTHSPTTVALAPGDSLHVIARSNSTRIEKVSKDSALSVLTRDIPTLSIDYENRRQVFVESAYDARTYDELFLTLKGRIGSPRTLSFIEVDPARNTEGGCDRLKAIVEKLRSAGNKKVCGIVDFDGGGHQPQDGIYQMAGRYAIENWTLDPLLLGAFLVKTQVCTPAELGLSTDTTYIALGALDSRLCQILAEATWRRFGFDDAHGLSRQRYVGDFEIDLPNKYRSMNGHDLEERILNAEPRLLGITKKQGPLFPHVISKVARDLPAMIPMEFNELFLSMLT